MPKSIKYDVFGKTLLVVWQSGRWHVYYPGTDGKRRPATDIVVPPDTAEEDLEQYLADLCHEWATPKHHCVVRVKTSHR